MLRKPLFRFGIALFIIFCIMFAVIQLKLIIVPFLAGYIFHFALKPFVNILNQRGIRHRTSVVIVFIVAFCLLGGFLKLFVPAIISEFHGIQANIPTYSQELTQKFGALEDTFFGEKSGLGTAFNGNDADFKVLITEYISGFLITFLKQLPGIVISSLPLFLFVFIIPFATFFFLLDEYKIKKVLIDHVPNRYFETTLNLMHSLNRQFGLLLGGMLVTVLLMSTIISLLLWMIGIDYPIILGIFAGVSNLIPYAGPVVGTFAGFIISLMTGAPNSMYLYVVLVFVAANLIENIFIQPIIYARAANLHPLIVIFLVLSGSRFGGIVGMLAAVPVASLLQVTVKILYKELARPARPDFNQYKDIVLPIWDQQSAE